MDDAEGYASPNVVTLHSLVALCRTKLAYDGFEEIGDADAHFLQMRGTFDRETCHFSGWVTLPNLIALSQTLWRK